MGTETAKRKLTAILSADVKEYSRLMEDDEEATVRTITAYREVMAGLIEGQNGRVVDAKGDNVLAEFPSVVDAVRCAVEIQKQFRLRNAELPEHRRMEFRIGINLGDVIEEEETIYGDGVNIAARIEGLAEGGSICISRMAFDSVKNKLNLGYEYLGEHSVKNIAEPVRVYKVLMEPEYAGKVIGEKGARLTQWRWAALAVAIILIIVAGALGIRHYYLRPPPPSIEPASVERMAFPLPEKPSIAVLPFENLSSDPGQEYLADGITENIITALSKIPEIFVIARNSTLTYKNRPVKVQQVSEELGVQHILEGSVQKEGDRVRITAQLVDAIKGHHLWAERYDRDLKDVFTLQDDVTLKILAALRVKLTDEEQARVQETTDNLEAWGYFVRGLGHFQWFTREGNAKAQELFRQAVELDPGYSYAWAMLGWTHWVDATFGYRESRSESLKGAIEIAKRALALDDKQPDVHALLGGIYLFQRQYEKASAEGEKAIRLGPNIACNHAILAQTMLFSGRFEEAIGLVKKAMRLNPHYPSWYLEPLATAYGMIGRHKEAIAAFKGLLSRRRKAGGQLITPLLGLTANSIMLGLEEEARSHATEVLKIEPSFSLEWFRQVTFFRDPVHLERTLEALRKAGLPEKPPLPLPDKPSIAVLPFVNMSDDPKQEYFSDGMTEDLITDLSKISGLFVIARNSVFTYKGRAVKVEQVGRDLGVRYIMEGSVRKSGEKVRINAQLIDSKTGGNVWAERYDRDLKDIFVLQDEVTQKIVTALLVKLTEDEQVRLVRKGTDSLEAYDYTLRGDDYFFRFTKEANAQAQKMFKKAIALDPKYALAYSGLGWTRWMEWSFGWSRDPQSLESAFESAQKAISLDDSLSKAHALLGKVYLWKKKHDQAIAELEKTITLNPNYADGLAALGEILYFAGRPEEAIAVLKKAIRLNPIPPVWYFHGLGHAYFLAGRYEEAIAALKRVLNRNPNFWPAHVYLAASYVELGQEEEARAEAADLLKVHPNFSLQTGRQRLPYKDQAVLERLGESLRKAGIPE
jgi:adenylate cyclase